MPMTPFLVSFRPLLVFFTLLLGTAAIFEHLNLFLDFLKHDRVAVDLLPLLELFLLDQDKWVILHP